MDRLARQRCILALGLAMAYGLMVFAPALVLVQFHLDRAEIIRTLCVERTKPMEKNCCKGSCQLTKRLEAASSGTSGGEAPPRVELVEVIAIVDRSDSSFGQMPSLRIFPATEAHLEKGVRTVPDPVPWTA
ncbi:MAG: hypothetical protein JNL52_04825 [Flavobacteriales bacterium]|nr:hypothetical protein [Flavobacteriales bacterium]